ncbi:probable flavin-containing monooxygenase 1 [Amaranthus tricolor]|uniref:probable flavin-containing monooxygenase 1 n=1 Tax=Amaranthus tricolor TaxID=29722 RepID=UPI002584B25D|nr:probable flavin-containing monooxygenase 1 [Amaranthus tricolor]
MEKERNVCIVGAGISGLLACKYALAKGYHPLGFESQNTIGGAWTQTVETTKLQTPKFLYQFSDFVWPSSVETLYPKKDQVFDYIQSYAKYFDLLKHFRFNTKVVSIKYEGTSHEEIQSWALWGGNGHPFGGNGKWIVTAQDLLNQSIKEYEVDFVILCVGKFTGLPNKPEFPIGKGPEVFEGKVLHAMEYAALDDESARDLVKGKHVIVVGFQKYALDIATECSIANEVEHPCTVLYRTPHWHMPDQFPWGIAIGYLYLNRFSELLVHKPGEGLLLYFLACILSPLRWGISKLVELYIKRKLPLKKYGVIPKHSFLLEMNSCGISTVPKGFYENVEKGSIILKKSPNTISFFKEGVVLDEHEYVKSDLVILATGFNGDQKLKDIFESQTFQDYIYGSSKDSVPLHRECIHPRIPQLAIIGYSESISNLFTSEMRCRWLFEFLDGKFKLPSIQEMEKGILECDKYMKRYSGKYYRKSCIGALHVWYNDQLCKDMGLNPMRKNGFWAELFDPYGPMDYV